LQRYGAGVGRYQIEYDRMRFGSAFYRSAARLPSAL